MGVKRKAKPKSPTKRLRSPITWFGGKGNMTAKLLPLIPRHTTYVEAFGGGAALLFAKAPSMVEVYNDLDEGLVNLFRVLRDWDKFDRFRQLVELTPYSRAEWKACADLTKSGGGDDVERAWAFYVAVRIGWAGAHERAVTFSVTHSRRGMSAAASKWMSCVDALPAIYQRMMPVQIECQDFRKLLPHYDREETFFYIDPPYPHATRNASSRYRVEMTDDDHRDLVALLRGLDGMAMVSTYPNPIYAVLRDAGWHEKRWRTACYAAGGTRATGIQGKGSAKRKQPRTEQVYINPKAWDRLQAGDTHHGQGIPGITG